MEKQFEPLGVYCTPAARHCESFIFLSMEDETGIANIIIHPELYERERLVVTRGKFLLIEGTLQNQDNVIHVKAVSISPLHITNAPVTSHDFH